MTDKTKAELVEELALLRHRVSELEGRQRHRIEPALRESETRFADIAANAQEWIWEVDAEGKYTYASSVVEKLLGYRPTEVLGKRFYDFFHDEDREDLKQAAFEIFAQKHSFREFVNRNVRKNGSTVWFSTSGVPVIDGDGTLRGYRGADADITNRVLTEMNTRRLADAAIAMLRLPRDIDFYSFIADRITKFIPGAMVYVNSIDLQSRTLRVRYCAGAESCTLDALDELLGGQISSGAFEGVHDEAIQHLAIGKLGHLPGGFPQMFFERLPGSLVDAFEKIVGPRDIYSIGLSADGKLLGNVTILAPTGARVSSDIVEAFVSAASIALERRQVETALRESERQFRDLCELLPQTVYEMTLDGRLAFVNRNMLDSFGFTDEEFRNGLSAYDMLIPEDHERAQRNAERVFRGEIFPGIEYTAQRKDGSRFPIMVFSTRVIRAGKLAGLRGIGVDITKRKQAEQALREHDAELAHMTRLTTMGELVAEIAHELNQPLGVISNCAVACKRLLSDAGNEKVVDALDEISKASARGGAITRRLRKFIGHTETKRQSVDIADVVNDSLRILGFEFQRNAISVRVESSLEGGSCLIDVDPVQIEQVLVNLLQNACEAMQELAVERRQIAVGLSASDCAVTVTVEDHGAGVPESSVPKMFDTYVTTKADGMGMGLGIAKRLIEHHGGRLWYSPKTDHGAIFCFSLPLAESNSPS